MSMVRKKSKYLSEAKFWAFGSLKAEKTRGGAIMAPPHVDTLFQIPCGIGLRKRKAEKWKKGRLDKV